MFVTLCEGEAWANDLPAPCAGSWVSEKRWELFQGGEEGIYQSKNVQNSSIYPINHKRLRQWSINCRERSGYSYSWGGRHRPSHQRFLWPPRILDCILCIIGSHSSISGEPWSVLYFRSITWVAVWRLGGTGVPDRGTGTIQRTSAFAELMRCEPRQTVI